MFWACFGSLLAWPWHIFQGLGTNGQPPRCFHQASQQWRHADRIKWAGRHSDDMRNERLDFSVAHCVKRWALVQRQRWSKMIKDVVAKKKHITWLMVNWHCACQSSGSRLCVEVIFIVDGKLEISNSHPVRNLIARSSKKGTRDADKAGNSTTRAWDNLFLSLLIQISEITLCQT
jgi:hypothetical protein